MKKLVLYSIALSLSIVAFLPISAVAQKGKSLAAKQVDRKTVDDKTVAAKAPGSKPIVQVSANAHKSSALEQAVFDEINEARKDPQKYAAYLEEYKKLFKGKVVYFPNYLRIETNEGIPAVDEAIEFLKKAPRLAPYNFSNGLNKSTALQLSDLIADSSIGHTSRDGSNLAARLKKFGSIGEIYAENIAYFADSPRDIVLMMIIDDGVKSRSHRNNVFSSNFKVVGIAFGKGKTGEGLCVVNFADSLTEPGQRSTGTREF